jgi:hypothetical protein
LLIETLTMQWVLGERGRLARSGRHLAGRPESRDKDPSPRHPPARRTLAGKMPARTGRMPALPPERITAILTKECAKL